MIERAVHRRARRRRGAMVAAAIVSCGCAVGTGFAVVNPFQLALGGELSTLGAAGLFLFLAVAFALAPWRATARVGAAVGTAALGLIMVLSMVALRATPETEVLARSVKAETGHELVMQWNVWIDATPVILLRQGTGPFRQESLVYRGPMHGDLPTDVRFVGENRISFSTDRGTLSSEYDPWTLKVDPVHCEPGGC